MKISCLRRGSNKDQFTACLTVEQWREVAARSASDYHDWMDAIDDAPFTAADHRFKTIKVGRREAEWIGSLFGIEVIS